MPESVYLGTFPQAIEGMMMSGDFPPRSLKVVEERDFISELEVVLIK